MSSAKNKKVLKQTLSLFGSFMVLMVLGFAIKYIQTRELGDLDYGRYAFFISISSFLALFFRFGYFVSAQVLLAQNHNPIRERKIIAASTLIATFCGVLLVTLLYLGSFIIDDLFQSDIGSLLRTFSPLCIIFPFSYLIHSLSVGTNRIGIEVSNNILPKSLFLALLLILVNFGTLDVAWNILLNLSSSLLLLIIIISYLRPDFSGLKYYLGILHLKNKKYGVHYYLGAIANQTTYRLDELFITYFIHTTQLGFYTLAHMICSPMVTLSRSITSALFKRFSSMEKIPSKVFAFNTLWLLLCLIGLSILAKPLVGFLFGEEFNQVADYIPWMALVFLIHGLSVPFGFLAAKSQGKMLRNVSWGEAVVNILGNFFLIREYGVYGAIAASVLAKFTNLSMMAYYYRKFIRS